MTPTLSIEVFQGFECDRVLQVTNVDGTPATGTFTADSIPHAMVWAPGAAAITCQPTAGWYTNKGTQTGYDQGQVSIQLTAAQTAALNSAIVYNLLITETTGGIGAPLIFLQVTVIETPGPVPA